MAQCDNIFVGCTGPYSQGVQYLRNHETPNERTYSRSKGYDFPVGTTVLNKRNFMTAGDNLVNIARHVIDTLVEPSSLKLNDMP